MAVQVFTTKLKGNDHYLHVFHLGRGCSKYPISSEIKRLLHIVTILSDVPDQSEVEAGCYINNLQMQTCREGCANCFLNSLHYDMECEIRKAHFDDSKSMDVLFRKICKCLCESRIFVRILKRTI